MKSAVIALYFLQLEDGSLVRPSLKYPYTETSFEVVPQNQIGEIIGFPSSAVAAKVATEARKRLGKTVVVVEMVPKQALVQAGEIPVTRI